MEITPLKYIQSMYEQAQAEYAANRQARERAAYTQAQGLVSSPYRNAHPAYAGLASLWGPEKNFMSGAMAHRKEQMGIDNEAMNVIQKFLMEGQEDLSQREKSLAARLASKQESVDGGYRAELKIGPDGKVWYLSSHGVPSLLNENDSKLIQQAIARNYATLEKEGGMTVSEMNAEAQRRAMEEYVMLKSKGERGGGFVDMRQAATPQGTGVAGVDPVSTNNNGSSAVVTEEDAELLRARLNGTKDPAVRETLEKNLIAVEKQLEKQRGVSTSALPASPKVQTEALAPTGADTYIKTKAEEKQDEVDIVGNRKFFDEWNEKLSVLPQALSSIEQMEQLNLSDTTSGPLTKPWETIGGIASYFDPQSTLAKQAANSNAYYSQLMNLVRDKIKALGAGTAVSNLDLLTTQKSLADLSQTVEGRAKILGLLKAVMLAEKTVYNAKIDHYNSNKNISWKSPDHPIVAVLPSMNLRKNGDRIVSYAPVEYSKWAAKAQAANPNASPEDILRAWKVMADPKKLPVFEELLSSGMSVNEAMSVIMSKKGK